MHVGYCVAEWSNLDEWLFRIFQSCVGAPEQCSIVYYKIPGLEPRLSLADEIVKSILPKPDRKSGGHQHVSVQEWNGVRKNIEKLLSIRRRIAHQQVAGEIAVHYTLLADPLGSNKSTPNPPPEIVPWFAIYMSQSESLRGKLPEIAALKEPDLIEHAKSVQAETENLAKFYDAHLAKRPGAHAPLSHPLAPEK
jgi:hypothetical protein